MIKNKYAALTPVKPWWLTGKIDTDNCVAAYQAAGASSYVASKVNRANPGVYTATDGTAYPSWTASSGWYLNWTFKDYLETGISPNLKPSTYIARVRADGTSAARSIIGQTTTNNGLGLYLIANSNIPILTKINVVDIGSGTVGFAGNTNVVVAASYSEVGAYAHYLNGALNGVGTSNVTLTSTGYMRIGRHDNFASFPFSGWIYALAIYNVVLTPAQVYALTYAMNAL